MILSGAPSKRGVSNKPGKIVFTLIPSLERSLAIGRVMPTMPPLDAEYAAWPIWPSSAATEAVLTTAPLPPSSVDGSRVIIPAAE